jgi:plasmid stabilization system protein ParE
MNMTPQHYQLFAQLFESFLEEDSTAIGMIGGLSGGKAVAQKLHKDMGLAHDQQFQPVDKIAWSQLKDIYKGAWVLIKGAKGAGAIRAKNGYESIAVNAETGEVETFRDDRGGNNLDFLKKNIGKLVGFYVGKESGKTAELKRKRSDNQAGAGPQQVNKETLVKKFKPLWLRSIQAAEADVKGMIATMIKNGAYEKAERKLSILKSLQRAGDALETGTLEDTPGWLSASVQSAILMAASHHYPEETGEIQRSRYGSRELSSTSNEGPRKLLQDITDGDTKKLGTILGFFKRNLITA